MTGGGTVLLGPGTVVVAWRLRKDMVGTDCYFARVNDVLGPALSDLCGRPIGCRGHGDLCVVDGAVPRKVVGASQRQTGRHVIYLGVVLVADLTAAMGRYLQAPSRQPDYRDDRDHTAFCHPLASDGVTVGQVVERLQRDLSKS